MTLAWIPTPDNNEESQDNDNDQSDILMQLALMLDLVSIVAISASVRVHDTC